MGGCAISFVYYDYSAPHSSFLEQKKVFASGCLNSQCFRLLLWANITTGYNIQSEVKTGHFWKNTMSYKRNLVSVFFYLANLLLFFFYPPFSCCESKWVVQPHLFGKGDNLKKYGIRSLRMNSFLLAFGMPICLRWATQSRPVVRSHQRFSLS